MTGKGKKAAPVRKKANGYKMPAPIPVGEVITDAIAKKKWRIGPSIGVGGFGEIYSACNHESAPKSTSAYPYVIKIEPHENGPLFVEKHFYLRNASRDDITNFMKTKKLSSLGMPSYHGNGSHEYKGEKYRYLVLERYGKDLWSLFKESGRSFPVTTVFQLGLQMLDVLEYIHGRGYVHADIKGANILLGMKKGTENQAFLVDFGLATRVTDKEFKPDPKSAHNGTIEYTSRDAHLGVPTMRGDLEILGYNMLQWIVGELPWEKTLKDPKKVQQLKENFMGEVRKNISKNYDTVPDELIKFFEYIKSLKPKDEPNYTKCRQIFDAYLKTQGSSRSSKMEFSPGSKTKTLKNKKSKKEINSEEENGNSDEENEELSSNKIKTTVSKNKRKSAEPALIIKTLKKAKFVPELSQTPPVKRNHASIATQTSIEKVRRSPRNVTFDSPVSEVISVKRLKIPNYSESDNSTDLFEDSFVLPEKRTVKKKKNLIADEEVTVTRKIVRKKAITKNSNSKSWKDSPAIINGKQPPVN